MRPGPVLLSGLAHLLVAAALLVRFVPAPPAPPAQATVELIREEAPNVDSGKTASQGEGQDPRVAVPQAPPPAPPAEAAPPMPPNTPAADVPMPQRESDIKLPPPAPAARPTQQAKATPQPPTPPVQPAPQAASPPTTRLGPDDALGFGLGVIPAAPDSTVHNKPPSYPPESARRGEEGTVVLVVHVAPDGHALGVEVQSTSGSERLDHAAREAVARWQFRPALQNGAPVASDIPVQVRFVLKG